MENILVLGIGNLVQSDDGFGVHVIRALEKIKDELGDNVKLVDAGTSIIDQLSELSWATRLICIDVAEGDESPGTIYRFTPDNIKYRKSKFHHAHKINLFDALEMVKTMRKQSPETTIIAVQPEKIGWGVDLSSTLESKIQVVVDLVCEEITHAKR